MAYSGTPKTGPQQWAFLPTGPTTIATVAATSITLTLSQFVSTAQAPRQVLFWNLGADFFNVNFGTGVTVSPTIGTPIAAVGDMAQQGGSQGPGPWGIQILSTGKSPTPVLVLGGAGSATVYITPGEGSR